MFNLKTEKKTADNIIFLMINNTLIPPMIATKTADILQVSQYVRNNILNTQQHIQYQYTLFIIYKMKVKSRTDEFIHVFSHIVVHIQYVCL